MTTTTRKPVMKLSPARIETGDARIDWEGGALSTWKLSEGWSVIRRMTDGRLVIFTVDGSEKRAVAVFEANELDRARAYHTGFARRNGGGY